MSTIIPIMGSKPTTGTSDDLDPNNEFKANINMCFQAQYGSLKIPYCISTFIMLIFNSFLLAVIIWQIYKRVQIKKKYFSSKSNILYYLALCSCIGFEVFQFDTSFVIAYYVQIYFQSLYFLMLIFIFGTKALKHSINVCLKNFMTVFVYFAFCFYSAMLILNTINTFQLSNSKKIWLPCQSPYVKAIRFVEFILGMSFLFFKKSYSDQIKGQREEQRVFMDQEQNQKILRQKERNISLLLKANFLSQLIFMALNVYYISSSSNKTCDIIQSKQEKYTYLNAFLGLTERFLTYFAPLLVQIYVYWIREVPVQQQLPSLQDYEGQDNQFYKSLRIKKSISKKDADEYFRQYGTYSINSRSNTESVTPEIQEKTISEVKSTPQFDQQMKESSVLDEQSFNVLNDCYNNNNNNNYQGKRSQSFEMAISNAHSSDRTSSQDLKAKMMNTNSQSQQVYISKHQSNENNNNK